MRWREIALITLIDWKCRELNVEEKSIRIITWTYSSHSHGIRLIIYTVISLCYKYFVVFQETCRCLHILMYSWGCWMAAVFTLALDSFIYMGEFEKLRLRSEATTWNVQSFNDLTTELCILNLCGVQTSFNSSLNS